MKQCEKCPWKVSTDPTEIPNGYTVELHRRLAGTIRSGLESLSGPLRMMGCHEFAVGAERPCVGWLANQLEDNLGLRLVAHRGQIDSDYELDGEQHETFEGTLPSDQGGLE